jgi:hypothetical protein
MEVRGHLKASAALPPRVISPGPVGIVSKSDLTSEKHETLAPAGNRTRPVVAWSLPHNSGCSTNGDETVKGVLAPDISSERSLFFQRQRLLQLGDCH